jgi:hypothetical protein
MPNFLAVFTTKRDGCYGSSLYLVTPDWVLRCSGNTNGRNAETLARKRNIIYTKPGAVFQFPALGLTPVEGGHTGNRISAVINLTGEIPQNAPINWNQINGISWQSAVNEIIAAEAATHTKLGKTGRFSRSIGQLTFKND